MQNLTIQTIKQVQEDIKLLVNLQKIRPTVRSLKVKSKALKLSKLSCVKRSLIASPSSSSSKKQMIVSIPLIELKKEGNKSSVKTEAEQYKKSAKISISFNGSQAEKANH